MRLLPNERKSRRMTDKRKDDRLFLVLAVALFVAGCALHIACGDFAKGIDVLPDERRYLEIARSLFAGGDLIMRGAPSDFQKILYPVSLFPALLLPDGADQIRMVNVLNSVYACSTVFPVLLIARRLFDDPRAVAVSLVLAIITPDLMYSMTFMSESVFMPISLWMVYLCWRCFESQGRRELALSAAAGVLCYLVYLCKEVAWMYLIAFVGYYALSTLRRTRRAKRSLLCVAACAAGFFVPFIAMKLTLFSGLYNSYGQFGPEPFQSLYAALFGLYSIAQDGVYFVVGFGVFPVIYLALTYRDLPRETRDLLFFCLASLVVGLAVVVFTISMREDVGHVTLRQHLRYVSPLALVLLMLFMKQVAHFDPKAITQNPRRSALVASVTAAFCVLVAAFFGVANLSQGFDYSQFHLMRWLLKLVEPLDPQYFDRGLQELAPIADDDGELLSIVPLNWLMRAGVIAFTLAGMWLLMHRDKRVREGGGAAICVILATFMVANSVALYDYNRNAYKVNPDDVEEICAISDFLAESGAGRSVAEGEDADTAGGEEVIILLDDTNTGPNNLIDTYLQDGLGKYRFMYVKTFSTTFAESDLGQGGSGYLLVNSGQNVNADLAGLVATPVMGGDGSRYTLYRMGVPLPTPIP